MISWIWEQLQNPVIWAFIGFLILEDRIGKGVNRVTRVNANNTDLILEKLDNIEYSLETKIKDLQSEIDDLKFEIKMKG